MKTIQPKLDLVNNLLIPNVDDVKKLLLQEPANLGVAVQGLSGYWVFRFEEGPRAGYMGIGLSGEFGDWPLTQNNLTLAVMNCLPPHPTRFSI